MLWGVIRPTKALCNGLCSGETPTEALRIDHAVLMRGPRQGERWVYVSACRAALQTQPKASSFQRTSGASSVRRLRLTQV